MCNPRRVEITLTRQVREAWEREVERAAEVCGTLSGEARIRRPLDASLGGPALMALQNLLANGFEGWVEQEDGSYRHDVEGGYAVYHPDEHALEIVAEELEEIRECGIAREKITGAYNGEIQVKATGEYYDDGHAGRTEKKAREEAQQIAETGIGDALGKQLSAEADAEEERQDQALREKAEQAARERIAQRAQTLQPELQQRARARLEEVGIRARQSFHRLLASSYRDALVGMARRRGASGEDITTRETDEYLEIDIMLP